MKTLNPVLKAALESEEIIPAVLLVLGSSGGTLRFTTWGTSLLFGGNLYLSRAFNISALPAAATNIVDNATITVDDVDRAILATLEGSAIEGYSVDIIYAVLTNEYKVLSSINMFSGYLSQWDYSPGECRLVASSIFVKWARVTTAKITGSCRWRIFKGDECKYSGSQTECDRRYTTCENYQNEGNFGGFRWLPSMISKKINIQ